MNSYIQLPDRDERDELTHFYFLSITAPRVALVVAGNAQYDVIKMHAWLHCKYATSYCVLSCQCSTAVVLSTVYCHANVAPRLYLVLCIVMPM